MSGLAGTLAGRLRSLPRRPSAAGRVRALLASKRLRRRLLVLAAALLVLAAGYQFWLRDSSLVAVEKVTVTGLTTSDSERVRTALTNASRTMTTLNVDHEALERAVEGYPVVRELEVTTDFPHGLQIHVVEHVPAAIVVGNSGRVTVAGDGTILQGVSAEKRLPTVEVEGAIGVERLSDATALASAAIAGAAPAALRSRIADVGEDGRLGQVAQLRDGPEVIFGDTTRLPAKWAAASRVLADLEASGASYVDVRIPGRPAAGGLPAETITPVAPAGTTTTTPPAIDPVTGAAIDPATGAPIDPTTGTPIDPATGAPIDPATGMPIDTATGMPIDPATGMPIDPANETLAPPVSAQSGTTAAPAPGTVTETTTTTPAPTASPAPATPVPDGTGGGAAAAP